MKLNLSLTHFIVEIVIAVSISFFFSLFAKDFGFWFICSLVILLIWHHYNENSLLKLLEPEREGTNNARSAGEYVSQTVAYYKKRDRKEKIKTLRLLSKLNKNVQYLPDGILILQQNGDIYWCNNMAQQILDFYWDKKLHKNIYNIIFYDEFKNYMRQSQHKRPLVQLTHNQRYLEINITPYDDELNLLVVRDVTQMIRLLHSRQTFLSNMNHELRTPLTVLQGYLELLQNGSNLDPFQEKAIQSMSEQSYRMANLLQQLNVLAKIEGSTGEDHIEVEMSEMIESIQRSTMVLTNEQQIQFEITPNIKVFGDENQLQSAVSNLIYNAIKHAGQGALITVRWQYCEQGAEFSVTDNGKGIAPQHIPHLTERFYRVDESRSNQTGGSGLGLAIVKHALEQHGSFLEIQSEVGKGSSFRFVIKKDRLLSQDNKFT